MKYNSIILVVSDSRMDSHHIFTSTQAAAKCHAATVVLGWLVRALLHVGCGATVPFPRTPLFSSCTGHVRARLRLFSTIFLGALLCLLQNLTAGLDALACVCVCARIRMHAILRAHPRSLARSKLLCLLAEHAA
jgi:hypothetical protein